MLSCTKMNGNGNDFIMIDNRTRSYGAEELARFAREPLRLALVRKYRAMPSPEEVMDIYRTGF